MRGTPDEDPEFQIAPMIDILLVLLVFFMSIATTEVLQPNKAVQLPVAKDAADKATLPTDGQSMVNVLWNKLNNKGSIEIDQTIFDQPAEVIPLIQKKLAANPEMRVLLRADKEVQYAYLRTLLQAVAKAGVGNVTFSVVDKEDPGATAPKTASNP